MGSTQNCLIRDSIVVGKLSKIAFSSRYFSFYLIGWVQESMQSFKTTELLVFLYPSWVSFSTFSFYNFLLQWGRMQVLLHISVVRAKLSVMWVLWCVPVFQTEAVSTVPSTCWAYPWGGLTCIRVPPWQATRTWWHSHLASRAHGLKLSFFSTYRFFIDIDIHFRYTL